MLDTKTCSRCGEAKPLDAFYVYGPNCPSRAGRVHAACKECEKAKTRRYAAENPEKALAATRAWAAAHPEKTREQKRRQYHKDPEKYKAKVQAYQAAHREQVKEIKRKAARVRKARKLANGNLPDTVPAWVVKRLFDLFEHKCAYCKINDAAQLDHVHPISKGGAHSAENLLPVCPRCNSKKAVTLPKLFAKSEGIEDLQALLARVQSADITKKPS